MLRRIYILLLGLLLILSTIVLYSNVNTKTVSADFVGNRDNTTIVIDCGHGGEDGGAVSANGTVEKDINLKIGLTLKSLFMQNGFKVVMIRETDKAIYSASAESLKDKKVSDLHNRSDICNSSQENIYISIHQNKFEESKYRGSQVFYSPNLQESKLLAESVRVAIKGLLQNDNERQCKEASSDIYILDKAQVPAILVECGFLSNPEEETLLNQENYQNQIAFSIYCGFLEFYNNNFR
ncbi:MAG: N-acetylmuramoyl-L-alanine amidase [Ruminococcus sp.]|nr:N-acetylmuramoyl-L-alanine amidase [Ruminococcus sp.]